MKQHAKAVIAVLVLVVFGQACADEGEQGSQMAEASQEGLAQPAVMTAGWIDCQAVQRPPRTDTINPRGGFLRTDYAGAFFPHGAYDATTTVTMTAHDSLHGISLQPPPRIAVVALRIGYCGDNSNTSDYSLTYQSGLGTMSIPAARLPFMGSWAAVMVGSDPFVSLATAAAADTAAFVLPGGFVVLSN